MSAPGGHEQLSLIVRVSQSIRVREHHLHPRRAENGLRHLLGPRMRRDPLQSDERPIPERARGPRDEAGPAPPTQSEWRAGRPLVGENELQVLLAIEAYNEVIRPGPANGDPVRGDAVMLLEVMQDHGR